ncbi:hypothetical protein J7J83_02975 [bacterium]|nr:hypothetical protein [bacterium]
MTMDKLLFLHQEIKHVLDVIGYFSDEERQKMMTSVANESYEELVKLLKKLYKIEREYFEFRLKDTQNTDEFIKTLKPAHD